jgi:hypothetical protein
MILLSSSEAVSAILGGSLILRRLGMVGNFTGHSRSLQPVEKCQIRDLVPTEQLKQVQQEVDHCLYVGDCRMKRGSADSVRVLSH